jgi:glycosyltransferase involved in cell wall biosynthesis
MLESEVKDLGEARVAAIIPAYNEEMTVGQVVEELKKVTLVDHILVVSDGSEDNTAVVAREAVAEVIELPENQGKGAAMLAGLQATRAEVVLFLDADLIGLNEDHIKSLLEPVLENATKMTVGVFEGGRPVTDLAQAVAPHLSGQRALRRHLLEQVEDLDACRFGVEIALTRYLKKSGTQYRAVVLKDMTHRIKEEKLGLAKGFAARMKMYWEIIKYLP